MNCNSDSNSNSNLNNNLNNNSNNDYFILSDDEYYNVTNCIKQHIKRNYNLNKLNTTLKTKLNELNEPYAITVWFPDMANKYLNSKTNDGELCILTKKINGYSNEENIKKIKLIFDNELVPIEILKDNQGYFFAFPKYKIDLIYKNPYEHLELISVEYDIPDISNF